jgi:hypothetical protein
MMIYALFSADNRWNVTFDVIQTVVVLGFEIIKRIQTIHNKGISQMMMMMKMIVMMKMILMVMRVTMILVHRHHHIH